MAAPSLRTRHCEPQSPHTSTSITPSGYTQPWDIEHPSSLSTQQLNQHGCPLLRRNSLARRLAPHERRRWMQVMNMMRVALAALLICMSAEVVAQEISTPRFPSQQITRDELNQLYEKTKTMPQASIRRVQHQVVITAPNSRYFSTTYVFTQPGHPAHPAVVIHDILEMETGHVAQLESYYAGSQPKFEAWVKKFVYTPYAIYPPTD